MQLENKAVAYVDGSYNPKSNSFSYGVAIFHNNKEILLSEAFKNPEFAKMRNVSGEVLGATQTMIYCLNHNISELDLYYDYEGVEKWCTGEWRANKELTQIYRDFYNTIKNNLKVNFIKIKAHSGNELNDKVDKLAKKALGI